MTSQTELLRQQQEQQRQLQRKRNLQLQQQIKQQGTARYEQQQKELAKKQQAEQDKLKAEQSKQQAEYQKQQQDYEKQKAKYDAEVERVQNINAAIEEIDDLHEIRGEDANYDPIYKKYGKEVSNEAFKIFRSGAALRGGKQLSSPKAPTLSVPKAQTQPQTTEVFVGGQGFSVAPEYQESFIEQQQQVMGIPSLPSAFQPKPQALKEPTPISKQDGTTPVLFGLSPGVDSGKPAVDSSGGGFFSNIFGGAKDAIKDYGKATEKEEFFVSGFGGTEGVYFTLAPTGMQGTAYITPETSAQKAKREADMKASSKRFTDPFKDIFETGIDFTKKQQTIMDVGSAGLTTAFDFSKPYIKDVGADIFGTTIDFNKKQQAIAQVGASVADYSKPYVKDVAVDIFESGVGAVKKQQKVNTFSGAMLGAGWGYSKPYIKDVGADIFETGVGAITKQKTIMDAGAFGIGEGWDYTKPYVKDVGADIFGKAVSGTKKQQDISLVGSWGLGAGWGYLQPKIKPAKESYGTGLAKTSFWGDQEVKEISAEEQKGWEDFTGKLSVDINKENTQLYSQMYDPFISVSKKTFIDVKELTKAGDKARKEGAKEFIYRGEIYTVPEGAGKVYTTASVWKQQIAKGYRELALKDWFSDFTGIAQKQQPMPSGFFGGRGYKIVGGTEEERFEEATKFGETVAEGIDFGTYLTPIAKYKIAAGLIEETATGGVGGAVEFVKREPWDVFYLGTLGAAKGYQAGKKVLTKPIVVSSKLIEKPTTYKILSRPVTYGDDILKQGFKLKGTQYAPSRLIETTTRWDKLLGRLPKAEVITGAKYKFGTPFLSSADDPFYLLRSREGAKFGTFFQAGIDDVIPYTDDVWGSLSQADKYAWKKVAEDITGTTVSLKNVPKILKQNEARASTLSYLQKQGRVYLGKDYFSLFPEGRRTTRAISAVDAMKLAEGDDYLLSLTKSFSKDVTKATSGASRASGKPQKAIGYILEMKTPLDLTDDVSKAGKWIKPTNIKRTPFSSTFQLEKPNLDLLTKTVENLPKLPPPRIPTKAIAEVSKAPSMITGMLGGVSSVYAGKGQYETTTGGGLVLPKSAGGMTKFDINLDNAFTSAVAGGQLIETSTDVDELSLTGLSFGKGSADLTTPRPKIDQKMDNIVVPIFGTDTTFKRPQPPIPTEIVIPIISPPKPKPPKPIPPFGWWFPSFKPKVAVTKQQGYDVFVKSKGRFNKITKQPLTRVNALNLGANVTDKTLSAQFSIKPTKKQPQQPQFKVPQNYWTESFPKFRPYKVRKGVKQPFKPTAQRFIEKATYRLDTPSEVKKIGVARYLSGMKTSKVRKQTIKTKNIGLKLLTGF